MFLRRIINADPEIIASIPTPALIPRPIFAAVLSTSSVPPLLVVPGFVLSLLGVDCAALIPVGDAVGELVVEGIVLFERADVSLGADVGVWVMVVEEEVVSGGRVVAVGGSGCVVDVVGLAAGRN